MMDVSLEDESDQNHTRPVATRRAGTELPEA
jgi:hypothetical protein